MKTTNYYKKIKLYGAGHPQLPMTFGVKGTSEQIAEFFSDHETTHARFEQIDESELSEIDYISVFDCDAYSSSDKFF